MVNFENVLCYIERWWNFQGNLILVGFWIISKFIQKNMIIYNYYKKLFGGGELV